MIPHPPRSTLFPNTTFSRSGWHVDRRCDGGPVGRAGASHRLTAIPPLGPWRSEWPAAACRSTCSDRGRSELRRSEEHTSELQSRQYLVCRLLLEKKKITITT